MSNDADGELTTVVGLSRRKLLTGFAGLAAGGGWTSSVSATGNHAGHLHPAKFAGSASSQLATAVLLSEEYAQPVVAMALRVAVAMERLGEPFDAELLAKVKRLEAAGQLGDAARLALDMLQGKVLLSASVTPEARVSVKRAMNSATLVQAGWRLYLVRIDNPTLVPGHVRVSSPNAVPVNGLYPPGAIAGGQMGQVGVPTTQGDIAQRWLDLELQDQAPMEADLEALPVDFKIVGLYARDAGRRSAALRLDIGPGTGDIGERDHVTIVFDVLPAQTILTEVKDVAGESVTCSFLITDALGRVYPSQTRRSPPDMFFQRKVYRADGQHLTLPAGQYQVQVARGPEYRLQNAVRTVADSARNVWSVQLERWVDPGARGWYSGDHHIHAAGCAHYEHPESGVGPGMIMPQVRGEALAIASALTWGPGFYTQKLNFSGHDDPLSSAKHILHYDLEVSGFPSSHCGHLALLQMKAMDFPGTTRIEEWPSSNAPVLRWARAQGAVTGYAHSGVGLWAATTELPNYRMPPFDGIGANDYIVTLPEGLVDFISTCNHPPAAEMNIWYHTLNVGLRSRIAGETDWPCFFEESIGMGRSYVKLDAALTYPGWCGGLKAGRSYVSEGRAHFFDFAASTGEQKAEVGVSDLVLRSPASICVEADTTVFLEPVPTAATETIRTMGPMDKPYWHVERARIGEERRVLVELVVNGQPVESRAITADGEVRRLKFDFIPEQSCWIALRIANAAHTNPIWISVGDAQIRVRKSAEWCRAAVDQCWSQKVKRIRMDERAEETALYDRGRRFYERMIAESPP